MKVYNHTCKTCKIKFTSGSSRSVYCTPEHNPRLRKFSRKDDGVIISPSHHFTPEILEYERQRNFAIAKATDISNKKIVKVNNRTWIAVPSERNEQEAIDNYKAHFVDHQN